MGVTEAGEKCKYTLRVFPVAPHILGFGATWWRGAAGKDPQEATFQ